MARPLLTIAVDCLFAFPFPMEDPVKKTLLLSMALSVLAVSCGKSSDEPAAQAVNLNDIQGFWTDTADPAKTWIIGDGKLISDTNLKTMFEGGVVVAIVSPFEIQDRTLVVSGIGVVASTYDIKQLDSRVLAFDDRTFRRASAEELKPLVNPRYVTSAALLIKDLESTSLLAPESEREAELNPSSPSGELPAEADEAVARPREQWTAELTDTVMNSCVKGTGGLAYATSNMVDSYCWCTVSWFTERYLPSEFSALSPEEVRTAPIIGECRKSSGLTQAEADYAAEQARAAERKAGVQFEAHRILAGLSSIYSSTPDLYLGLISFVDLDFNDVPATVPAKVEVTDISGPCKFRAEVNSVLSAIEVRATAYEGLMTGEREECHGQAVLTRLDSQKTASVSFSVTAIR